ncbi:helix-turn-helix transcriptional regulator [Marivibrio halodurans]|uniref:Helix-turn-helix transcriptional regulator n=1 Tax=Marivibrio halodurans TaxID=2039722 RepID=A0A8J7V298_9PROT|nr:helix-turn-helix transcriptional regulator [Marivibrio halodurans]MBP5856647.1 helix-turn-helix transcriptional regulator [Marivibrio halodurans]
MAAHPTDIAVGRRVRELRVRAGLSQQALAERIGLSFQQVQKYEKGTNRMGASRLIQIAGVLNMPVEALFEGLETSETTTRPSDNEDVLLDRDAARVARDWIRIPDQSTREIVRDMIRTLARTQTSGGNH